MPDQPLSMRETAYVNVLRAAAAVTAAVRERQLAAEAVQHLEQTVEAARFYAPGPLDAALQAVLPAAHRWVHVVKANGPEHSFAREAGQRVEQHVAQIRTLMRDDALPAAAANVAPAPAPRYADDSTMLARMRIQLAREKPLAQQQKALDASWADILRAAFFDLLVSLLWTTIWFKAAVWVIGTYWFTNLPTIGWLPAVGLIFVLKLLQIRWKASEPAKPFPLPPQSETPAEAPNATTESGQARSAVR